MVTSTLKSFIHHMHPNIQIDSIIIDDRLRKDYGDLEDLNNIASVGLIEPIILQEKHTPLRNGQPLGPRGEDFNREFHLVAGGRRISKLIKLGFTELEHGVTSTPGKAGYLFRDEMDKDIAKEVELYENLSRKSMTWQERVRSIEEIHVIKVVRLGKTNATMTWTEEMTGAELGVKRAHTNHLLMVARALKDPNSPVHKCENFTDAFKTVVKLKEDAARARQLELAKEKSNLVTILNPGLDDKAVAPILREPPKEIPLSLMLRLGKMETILGYNQYDGIYTDWPYAIDMDNLQQSNLGMDVSSTAAEHDADDNEKMFPVWMSKMFLTLKESGFCIIWYDLSHQNLMTTLAEAVGFKVQRWPFHWVKTHPCQNGAAQYNQTKTVEHAMILRKGNATLFKQIPNNYWIGTFEPGERREGHHPFTKPRKLHERVLSDFFQPGMQLLDPFAGAGSIPLAEAANGFQPYAIEMVAQHYNEMEFAMKALYEKLTINNVKFT